MTPVFRGILLASLSLSVIALGACSSTGSNVSDKSAATRVDQILERAAREAKASGDKTQTVALLEQIYNRNPDDAAVATAYGQALREDEQLNLARQVLVPYTEGKNAYPDAVTELSMVQLALGQYKEAELTARRSVELDSKQGRAYLALGTALDAQNYHEQAEVAFRKGIDLWQGDPAPIMNNLALNLASQNKLDQAIDMLQKAKAISPGRVELERNMRIITTLKEGADDFYTKQNQKPAKPSVAKNEAAPAPAKAEGKQAKTSEPVVITPQKADGKKEEKVTVKKETVKTPSKTVTRTEVKVEKVEPSAAATNTRGSKQNFNSAKTSVGNE